MTEPLQPIQMHYTAKMTDLTENNMHPSSERLSHQPLVDLPGRDPQDTLVNPMTAISRYNAYKKVVTGDDNIQNWMQPSPFTGPEQVQLYLTGSFGSTGNYLTPPTYASTQNGETDNWNTFWSGPSYRGKYTYSLDGRPTHSMLLKTFDQDTLPADFVFRSGFAPNRPTTDDFEQSMNIKVNPGAEGQYEKGYSCSCKVDLSRGALTVNTVAMSSANYTRLYSMMRDAQILGPIEKLIIYEGRTKPCLCSYITGPYASMFGGYTQNMISPAINEPDMDITLNTINYGFITQILSNFQATLTRRKYQQYKSFMGPTHAFSLPPMDPKLEEGMTQAQTDRMIGTLTATRYDKIDGKALFGSVDTFAGAYMASKPRISGWTEDMYILTGIDARPQYALVESGAVTTGLEQTIDAEKAIEVIRRVKESGDAELYRMGIPLE